MSVECFLRPGQQFLIAPLWDWMPELAFGRSYRLCGLLYRQRQPGRWWRQCTPSFSRDNVIFSCGDYADVLSRTPDFEWIGFLRLQLGRLKQKQALPICQICRSPHTMSRYVEKCAPTTGIIDQRFPSRQFHALLSLGELDPPERRKSKPFLNLNQYRTVFLWPITIDANVPLNALARQNKTQNLTQKALLVLWRKSPNALTSHR